LRKLCGNVIRKIIDSVYMLVARFYEQRSPRFVTKVVSASDPGTVTWWGALGGVEAWILRVWYDTTSRVEVVEYEGRLDRPRGKYFLLRNSQSCDFSIEKQPNVGLTVRSRKDIHPVLQSLHGTFTFWSKKGKVYLAVTEPFVISSTLPDDVVNCVGAREPIHFANTCSRLTGNVDRWQKMQRGILRFRKPRRVQSLAATKNGPGFLRGRCCY
jgi:hypothetical protein